MIKVYSQNYECPVCKKISTVNKQDEIIDGYFNVITVCGHCSTKYVVTREGLATLELIAKNRAQQNLEAQVIKAKQKEEQAKRDVEIAEIKESVQQRKAKGEDTSGSSFNWWSVFFILFGAICFVLTSSYLKDSADKSNNQAQSFNSKSEETKSKPMYNPNGCDFNVPESLILNKINSYGYSFVEYDRLKDSKDFDACSIMLRVIVKKVVLGKETDGLYRIMPTFQKINDKFELTSLLVYSYRDQKTTKLL